MVSPRQHYIRNAASVVLAARSGLKTTLEAHKMEF